MQAETSIKEVASGCPAPLQAALAHACGLRFDQEPDYALLHSLLACCISEDSATMTLVSASELEASPALLPSGGSSHPSSTRISKDAQRLHPSPCAEYELGPRSDEKPLSPPPKRGRTNKVLGPRPPAPLFPFSPGFQDGEPEGRGELHAAAASRARGAVACPSNAPWSPSLGGPLARGGGAGGGPLDGGMEVGCGADGECGHVDDSGPRTGRRRLVPGRWVDSETRPTCGSGSDDDGMEDAGGGDSDAMEASDAGEARAGRKGAGGAVGF
jgi:hypothetical protein